MFLAFFILAIAFVFMLVAGKASTHYAAQKAGGRIRTNAPALAEFAGVATVFFAAITAATFIPAGLILGAIAVGAGGHTMLFGLALLGLCISGLVFVGRATKIPAALAARDFDAVAKFARGAIQHHLAVGALFGLVWLNNPYELVWVAVPCLVGIALALACIRFNRNAALIPTAVGRVVAN